MMLFSTLTRLSSEKEREEQLYVGAYLVAQMKGEALPSSG